MLFSRYDIPLLNEESVELAGKREHKSRAARHVHTRVGRGFAGRMAQSSGKRVYGQSMLTIFLDVREDQCTLAIDGVPEMLCARRRLYHGEPVEDQLVDAPVHFG